MAGRADGRAAVAALTGRWPLAAVWRPPASLMTASLEALAELPVRRPWVHQGAAAAIQQGVPLPSRPALAAAGGRSGLTGRGPPLIAGFRVSCLFLAPTRLGRELPVGAG